MDPRLTPQRLEGSFDELPFTRLLDVCRQHHVTGMIRIVSDVAGGSVELRAGVVERARFGRLDGDAALTRLRELQHGTYRVSHELPTLDGELGDSPHAWGDLADVSLNRVMRHCEEHALTCTITMLHRGSLGEIEYRLGDLYEVRLDGKADDDAIVAMMRWRTGRFRMSSSPYAPSDSPIGGLSSAETRPFELADARRRRMARGTPAPEIASREPRAASHPLDGVASDTAYFVRPRGSRARDIAPRAEPVARGQGASPPLDSPRAGEASPVRSAAPPPAPGALAAAKSARTRTSGAFSAAPPPRALTSLPLTEADVLRSSSALARRVVWLLAVASMSFALVWTWLRAVS